MSKKSLQSKTITKRNVAQSSIIFSVVVALSTLAVIGAVAYMDFTEEMETIASEKSIPEMIADQKLKAEEIKLQSELESQSSELVAAMDKSAKEVKALEDKVVKVSQNLAVVTAELQSDVETQTQAKVLLEQAVITPAVMHKNAVQQSNTNQQSINHQLSYQPTFQINSRQNNSANGDAGFSFSWVFKARGKMDASTNMQSQHNHNNQWNVNSSHF